jgi:hypothetical protein
MRIHPEAMVSGCRWRWCGQYSNGSRTDILRLVSAIGKVTLAYAFASVLGQPLPERSAFGKI